MRVGRLAPAAQIRTAFAVVEADYLPDARLFLSDRMTMRRGCLFDHHVSFGLDTQLGDFVVMLAKSIVGYDVKIGSYCTVGSFIFIGGGAQIGKNVTIQPHATMLPGIKVVDNAIIGTGSVVIHNVPPDTTIFGNSAKPSSFW